MVTLLIQDTIVVTLFGTGYILSLFTNNLFQVLKNAVWKEMILLVF
ncbi:unnamed protein product [Schistosoma curassoni]|uniref:Colicin V production protein n=1 Tax=Schistosoma curassoni TaxID=6186 RepID=A0A183L7M2_9TREM|nr:unnamed protein product [Schistosoma curassoni]